MFSLEFGLNFDIVLKIITNRFSERQTQYEPNKAISDNFQHSIKMKSKFQTEHRNILILTLLLVSNYLGSRADKLQRFFKIDEKYAQSLSLLKDFSLTGRQLEMKCGNIKYHELFIVFWPY